MGLPVSGDSTREPLINCHCEKRSDEAISSLDDSYSVEIAALQIKRVFLLKLIHSRFSSLNVFKAGDMMSASPSLTNSKLVLPMIAMESAGLLKKSG